MTRGYDSSQGLSPLHIAAHSGKTKAIRTLVELKGDIEARAVLNELWIEIRLQNSESRCDVACGAEALDLSVLGQTKRSDNRVLSPCCSLGRWPYAHAMWGICG
jgi:hypothetical protein